MKKTQPGQNRKKEKRKEHKKRNERKKLNGCDLTTEEDIFHF